MSKFNMQIFLNSYSDACGSNSSSLNNFKWTRNINGLDANNAESLAFSLAPGESRTLFDGTRTLLQDGTTEYDLVLKALTSNTYSISWNSGTKPNFRIPRNMGDDATTQVSVTLNGPIATFSSVAGQSFNLISGSVAVGDFVRIGNPLVPSSQVFSVSNRGQFKILARTATSFSVENENAVIEGPITLGSDFANQISIYSASGVQIGDIIDLSGGFSPVTLGSYQITDVGAQFVSFYSTDVLPQESAIQTQAIVLYSNAKQFFYLESDQKCAVSANGQAAGNIEPFIQNVTIRPGIFAKSANTYSLVVTNNGTNTANLFLAAIE